MAVRCWQSVRFALLVTLSAMAGGCLNGNSKTGWSLPGGGSSSDFDRHAKRLEVRPTDATLPVGKQMLMLATIYDEDGKPRRKRRVDWKIEGPGVILEVDEGGYLQGRGFKEDSKSAVTFTDTAEHPLPPGVENPLGQVVLPGQTWCVITAAVEGQTVVHAYAPEIADPEHNRQTIKVNWVDARWQFPEPATVRAGTELMLQTRVIRHSDKQPAANYRVRYILLNEAPTAALYPTGAPKAGTPREAIVPTDADGLAKANIKELQPEFGTSKIGIEVQRPDPAQAGGYAIVARSQTTVNWQAARVALNIEAPRTAQLNQPLPITYSVSSTGGLETLPMMLKAAVPPGFEVVSASPKATADGNELLWSLPALADGKQHTVQAVYRPTRLGNVDLAAGVRTNDNLRADNNFAVQVTESRMQIALTGPSMGLVGESLPFQIVVKNEGSGPATNVKVSAQFDAALEVTNQPGPFSIAIDRLDAGQSRTIPLPLSPKQGGRSVVKALVTADGNQQAESPASSVDIKKPELKVEAYGPSRGYLDQEITWTVRIFNPSDVPVSNVVVRAALPAGFTFRKASNDGRLVNGNVEWNLGTAVGKQWADLQVTAAATKLGQATLTASAAGSPLANREGDFRAVSLLTPFASLKSESVVEILGVPALQLEVFDSPDPVQVGQTITYTIRVKNAGTLPASQIEVVADLPPQMKALRAFGPTNGKIDGQRITFPPIDSLRPNLVNVYTIDVQAISEGDGRFRTEAKSLSLSSPLRAEEATRILPRR